MFVCRDFGSPIALNSSQSFRDGCREFDLIIAILIHQFVFFQFLVRESNRCLNRQVIQTSSLFTFSHQCLLKPAWWQSCLVGFTLPQHYQLSITRGSILALGSKSKGGENLFPKPSTYLGGTLGSLGAGNLKRLSPRNGLSDLSLPNDGVWDPPR